jgi:hypothetical protein
VKDKVTMVMEETSCDRSEAELALELCGYDLTGAVQAVPRLFQNIVVLKGRVCAPADSLYGLWMAILNLKERKLLRARAVVSYNPAVFASELDQHWFDFEGRLYACRLWVGTMQELSQDIEQLLSSYFATDEARAFYEEDARFADSDFDPLRTALAARLGSAVDLKVQRDLLDMGQFQEVVPRQHQPPRPKRAAALGPAGTLVLNVALESHDEGRPAQDLHTGDMVLASINDARDIAQYLGKLFGAITDEGAVALPVPVEALERGSDGDVTIRVRFSAGVCGDVAVPGERRLKVVPRPSNQPWWKKIFGR